MSWMKYSGGRLPDFEDVVRRFPVAVLIMGIATIWLIFEIHRDDFSDDQGYIFGGFIFAGYSAVIGRLIGEARAWSGAKSAVLSIALALSAFLLGAFGERLKFIFPLAIGGAILFLGNAAAWRIARNDASVWNFTQKLWTGAIFAAVGSVIFAVGMFIISEAVRALFGLNLEDITIKTLLPVGLLFLAPVYWMGTLPRYGEAEDVAELSFEARALSFLGTWMLAPLVSIYALIILAYGAKVLLQWELPKGEIAFLVSPFLGVGMLVWLMLEPKVLNQGGFVRFYRAAWHWVMFAATVLLAIAVFVRIREYGFTTVRFLLMLIVIWGFVQSLWFILKSQEKRDIRIPTGIAAALLTFGAFVAEPISIANQFQRASTAKVILGDISNMAVKKNPEAAKKFVGGLEYFIDKEDNENFKKLLPEYEMPHGIYSPDWKQNLRDLGLNDLEYDGVPYRVAYNLASPNPVSIPPNSLFFGSYDLRFRPRSWHDVTYDHIISHEEFIVSFDLEGRRFDVDFEKIFKDLKLIGGDDSDVPIIVPVQNFQSDIGERYQLFILSGYIAFSREDPKLDGEIKIAFVVPD